MNCDKGWKDGSCCCNCKHHIKLYKHPWNTFLSGGQDSISEQMGYACLGFLATGEDSAIFFDKSKEHGMCELHQLKQPKKD